MAKVDVKTIANKVIGVVAKTYGLDVSRMSKSKAWPCFKEIMTLMLVETAKASKQRISMAGIGVFYVTKSRKPGGLKSFRFKASSKLRALIK